jgi:predicted transcriptional regulator of viral defense system
MATPEKAIIDLLHLYPEYRTAEDMRNLRLNENYMENEINQERMLEYEKRIHSPALAKRIKLLWEVYGLL